MVAVLRGEGRDAGRVIFRRSAVPFVDRADAGRRLGVLVRRALGRVDAGTPIVVVGLPRGGVPVAVEVARELDAPVDVIVVRKVGVPGRPELAMGAIGEGDVVVRNDDVIARHRVTEPEFDAAAAAERRELDRRVTALRGTGEPVPLEGSTVVVVDDGLATGASARAACEVARARRAARVVLAVPVAPFGCEIELAGVADLLVAAETPRGFGAVGEHYRDFAQVSDADVARMLTR